MVKYWYSYFRKLWSFLAVGVNGQCGFLYFLQLFRRLTSSLPPPTCWKYWNLENRARYDLHKSCHKSKAVVLTALTFKLCSVWGRKALVNISSPATQSHPPNRVSWSSPVRFGGGDSTTSLGSLFPRACFVPGLSRISCISVCTFGAVPHASERSLAACLCSLSSYLYTLVRPPRAFLRSSMFAEYTFSVWSDRWYSCQ